MKDRERVWQIGFLGLFLTVLAVAGLHLFIVADNAFLWTDELFSWWVIAEKSWSGLWSAMYRGSDGMFPAFYVVSWSGSQLFGHSELALRLPSLLFAFLGIGVCFALLRRLWGIGAATFSVGLMFVANALLLAHAGQFRGYGMLLGLTACGLSALVALSPTAPRRRWWLWANGVIQLLLCLTHPFGVLYSLALGIGKVVATARGEGRRWDWGLVWSYLPAGVGLIIWLPGIRAIARLNIPRSWVPPVTGSDLWRSLVPQLDAPWGWVALGAGFAVLLLAGVLFRREPREPPPRSVEAETAIILALAILGVGPLAWLVSQFTEPLLLPRYLIPSAWAWAILGAAAWSRLSRPVAPGAEFAAGALALGVACLGIGSLYFPQLTDRHSRAKPLQLRLRTARAFATGEIDRHYMTEKLPVLMEGIHSFLARDFYNPGKYDYRLVLNQQSAQVAGQDVLGASVETNLALKLPENGMAPEKIMDVRAAATLVEKLPAFYFIDLVGRPTTDAFQSELKNHGWREEVVCASLLHPNAGPGVIKKFSRPVGAVLPP
jgi:hypothetical protein